MYNLYNVTETSFIRRILGRNRFVACTEAASLDAINWANPSSSMSKDELKRLYATGAHTANGGRTTAQMFAAIFTRYHHTPDRVTSFSDALAKLRDGNVLTVAGDYGTLGTHFARWDLRFARGARPALHAVCVGPIDPITAASPDPLVAWRDPLAPAGYNRWEWARWSMVISFSIGAKDMLAYEHGAWI